MNLKYTLIAFAAMTGLSHGAGVIIDELTGNGGFVTTSIGETSNITGGGWTINGNIIPDDSSTLTSAPFGAETLASSTSLHIFNAGTTVTSDAFSLTAGESLNLTFDMRDANAVGGTIIATATDGLNTINLGTFDADGGWTQMTGTGLVTTSGSAYQLVFTDVGGLDLNIDRVYLESIPEPSSTALLGLGGLALILRRRK